MATLTHRNRLNLRGHPTLDILAPLRHWIDQIDIHSDRLAHLICRLIPCTCPFERNIALFGRTLHIPPLCKLNPLYNEFVSLRFRALSYLSDIRGEDVTKYIC
jgi:hypothetical protein